MRILEQQKLRYMFHLLNFVEMAHDGTATLFLYYLFGSLHKYLNGHTVKKKW